MHNFQDIEFPESDGENPLKSLGISDDTHTELFTKFMTAAKGIDQKSRVVKNIVKTQEFTDKEMKLIFLLAYDRATIIIQESGEKEFGK